MPDSSKLPSVAGLRCVALAREALRTRRPKLASQLLSDLLTAEPGNTDARCLLGIVAQTCGDHALAIDCFERVLPVRPKDAVLHVRLGIAQFLSGDTDQAIVTLRRACTLDPQSASAWFNLGEVLKQDAQRAAETLRVFARAVQLDPALVRAWISLARVRAGTGDTAGAATAYHEALRRESFNAWAWFGLSELNVVRFTAAELGQLRHAYAQAGDHTEARNLLGFALAKAYEHQNDYVQAFAAFKNANAAWRGQVAWDAGGAHARVEAIQHAFAQWVAPAPVESGLGREVIFIASLPRSGSSLVEQIVASHPQVEGANEIDDLQQVLDGESRRRGCAFPTWVPAASAEDWQRLGRAYLARTQRWRQRKPRFTDKSLETWQSVGAVIAMLPGARVVVVRRDPVETCLACFRQRFAQQAGFTYDLDDLANRYIDFMRLTRFWLASHSNRVFDLEYECLVAEPESTIRRLLDFCGLEFDPACLAFHQTERSVMSAPSAAQVREPLRRDTARAARYGNQLDALRKRLGDAKLI